MACARAMWQNGDGRTKGASHRSLSCDRERPMPPLRSARLTSIEATKATTMRYERFCSARARAKFTTRVSSLRFEQRAQKLSLRTRGYSRKRMLTYASCVAGRRRLLCVLLVDLLRQRQRALINLCSQLTLLLLASLCPFGATLFDLGCILDPLLKLRLSTEKSTYCAFCQTSRYSRRATRALNYESL